MTFNANVPNASQSPGLFPAQANTNFSRLRTIINRDHVFNNTTDATDGIHKQVTMRSRSTPSSLPAGNGILYSQTFDGANEVFWYNGITNRKVSGPAIFAAVNFNGTGAPGVQTIRSSYTVLNVTKTAVGIDTYIVNFKVALPNTDYIVQITGMRNAANRVCYGCVRGTATYGNSVKVQSIEIDFTDDSGNRVSDILMGNVVIYQIT